MSQGTSTNPLHVTDQDPQDPRTVRPDNIQVDPRLAFVDGRWIMRRDHAASRVAALWTWSMIGWGAGVVAATYLPLWGTLALLTLWTLVCMLAILGHLIQPKDGSG